MCLNMGGVKLATKTIYIYLLDEGTDAWRPTLGEELKENVFRVLPAPNSNTEDETWEFEPGQIVKCVVRKMGGEDVLVAEEEYKGKFD